MHHKTSKPSPKTFTIAFISASPTDVECAWSVFSHLLGREFSHGMNNTDVGLFSISFVFNFNFHITCTLGGASSKVIYMQYARAPVLPSFALIYHFALNK